MPSPIAVYFDDLRRRFPPESATVITDAQYSFETMEATAAAGRPPGCRCAQFSLAGSRFLVWELDEQMDRFMVFATVYCIPLGILHLATNPKGIIDVAGFPVDLEILADFIRQNFAPTRSPSSASPKRKVMAFGFYESFGHHFWNEVGGLAAAIDTGIFDRLDGILVGPFDYFHLEAVLRARGKKILKSTSTGALLPDQLLAFSSPVVTENARRLVLGNAAVVAPQPQSPPAVRRNICFQIHRHRRPWIHEEDKLVEIISACAREWPGTGFTIDGCGTSKGIIPIHNEMIAEEAVFAARIATRLAPAIDVRMTIGMDINEKINLLKHTDLFVGAIGSGGVMSSWILRKPTICYGPTKLYDMLTLQEHIVPEGGPMVTAVPKELIIDSGDDTMSFDVPADAIMALIRQQMNKGATT